MPVEMADAKAMARERLKGKNAKPRDVDKMAQRIISESYDTQRGGTKSGGGSYDYETASGQGMQSKGRGGGDRVEYQTSDLSNYIDKVLGMGGMTDAQPRQTTVRPATDDEISTAQQGLPEEGPIPASREEGPTTPEPTGGGPDLPLKEILGGTAGMAALYALYRYAKRLGKPPESLTPDEVRAAQAAAPADPSAEARAPIDPNRYQGPSSSINEAIDEQVSQRPRLTGTESPDVHVNPDEPRTSGPTPEPGVNDVDGKLHTIASEAASIKDGKERVTYLKSQGLTADEFDRAFQMVDELIQSGNYKIRTPKMKFR